MSRVNEKAEEYRRIRQEHERFFYETAENYLEDYRKLDSGEPYAHFNFVRLSNLYAVACLCYYEYDCSPMEDHTFDGLCSFLLDHYEAAMEAGVWGGVLDKEMLSAGSGYHCKSFRIPLHNIAHCTESIVSRSTSKV